MNSCSAISYDSRARPLAGSRSAAAVTRCAAARLGEEHRPGIPARGELCQQPGRSGLEVQRPDVAAFGVSPGPPVAQVEVGHVQAEDFLGAGGRVVQQPPQCPLPQ